jgi:hypothetical protein
MGMATVTAAAESSLTLEQKFALELEKRGLDGDLSHTDRFAEPPEASGVKAAFARQAERMGKEILALAFLLGVSNIEKGTLLLHMMELAAKQGLGRKARQVEAKQKNPLVVAKDQEKTGFTTIAAALTAGSAAAVAQAAKRKNPPAAFADQTSAGAQEGNESPRSLAEEAKWWADRINGNTMVAELLELETDDLVRATLRQLQKNPGALARVREYFVNKASADHGTPDTQTSDILKKMDEMEGTVDQSTQAEVAENKWEQLIPMFEALRATDDPARHEAIVKEIGSQVDLQAPTNMHIVATMQVILQEKRELQREEEEKKEWRSNA